MFGGGCTFNSNVTPNSNLHWRSVEANLTLTFKRFVQTQGTPLAPSRPAPTDNFEQSQIPLPRIDDPEMRNFMEKSLGGGKVASQKQFLDHDRKVLRFYV